jgi:DNA-binding MarR family transcriptional regulator
VLIGTAYRQGNEGVTIRSLADHTQLAATHVTTEVGRLMEKGLLTKSANMRDRRSVLVRLTPKGEAAIREINPLLRRVNDCLFQNIPRDDFAVVARFLSTFALNSENALAEIRRADRERAMRS